MVDENLKGVSADMVVIDEIVSNPRGIKCVRCGWRKPYKMVNGQPVCTVCNPVKPVINRMKKDHAELSKKVKK